MTRNGAEFDLPDEILSVIPTDPYEQLDLARRITSVAITSRVSRLEAEAGRLRKKLADRDRVIDELQDKLAHLDRLVRDSDARLRTALKENAKLSKERDVLAMTSNKLSRDMSQLETIKRQLMKSLSHDNLSQLAEAGDTGTYKQPIARVSSWSDDGSICHLGLDAADGSAETRESNQDGSKHVVHQYSIKSRLTPTSTPKFSSTNNSPKGTSPRALSGTTSPTKSQLEEHVCGSPLPASTQQSSVPSSTLTRPIPGRTPRADGKELFRQARTRLSYERFAAFLAAVKEFNAQKQSHEETLAMTEEIFGAENKDLYLSFQSLLNRALP